MSKKNGKNAQTAEAKTQEKNEVPKDPLEEPIVIPDDVRELAVKTGIPIDAIVDRANLVQSRVIGIEQAIVLMAKGLDQQNEELKPLVNLAKDIKARQAMSQTPQQGTPQQGGGGGLGDLVKLAPLLGGSEPDPMTKIFMEAVFKAGLENMFMGGALIKTFVSKTAPELFAKAMRETETTVSRVKAAEK